METKHGTTSHIHMMICPVQIIINEDLVELTTTRSKQLFETTACIVNTVGNVDLFQKIDGGTPIQFGNTCTCQLTQQVNPHEYIYINVGEDVIKG